MTVTATPIFPQTPAITTLSLASQTACTTRAPTATASLAAANITQFVNTSTNGLRIDAIQVKGCSSAFTAATVGNIVGIWIWDGTNAFLWTEVIVTVVTPSTTVASFDITFTPPVPLNLPSTYKLYASVSVTTTANTTALQVTAYGGAY